MEDNILDHGGVTAKLGDLPPSDLIDFLEKQYEGDKIRKPNREIDFLYYILDLIELQKDTGYLIDSRIKLIQEWIEEKRTELKEVANVIQTAKGKIKWKASPAVFSFIFRELVDKGYIEPPTWGAEWSYSGFAKQCLEHFDIQTESVYLEKAMRDKSSLAVTKTNKFTIPDYSEIA